MASYLILLIDDDPTLQLLVSKHLKLYGYEVINAEDGKKGLKIMDVQKPDLVLLDVNMPVMDGFQTLESIRKNQEFSDIPVLMLTSLGRQHLKIKGLELGADDYITKPFDQAELLARIKAALRRIKRTRRPEGMMEGSLTDLDLTDLLQSFELGGKTAIVTLPEIDSEIFLEDGELLHVRQGTHSGQPALIRILLSKKGTFSVNFSEPPDELTGEPKSITGALMGALADVDEIRAIVKRIKAGKRLIGIAGELTEFPTIQKIKEHFPAAFSDLIVLMEQAPKQNLKALIKAYKKGKLKVIN